MKRRIIVILSLILCFMLSCDEETLDKVFVQGGMDASSPKVVVAVDPDRVEAFEKGEVTSIKKESEVNSFETIKETPPVEVYSLTKEEVVLTQKEAVDSAKAEAEDDLKAYVDSLFSNEKTEIMEGVEKAKEDTILEKAPPITTPTARSRTLPRIIKVLNSFNIFFILRTAFFY